MRLHSSVRAGLFFTLTMLTLCAFSQNQSKADSVRSLIQTESLNSIEEMEAYYWLSAFSNSPEEELEYGKQLLVLANNSNNQEYLIKANQRIGVAHRLMGNLGKALEYLFESANNASIQEEFSDILADIYSEISACYTQNGDSENALLYGLKTIEILRKTDRKQELALNLLNIGYDYYLIANYDSAIACYNESEPILEEIGMTIGLAYIIGNRALVHWKTGDKSKAKADLFKAIEMLEPMEDRYGMSDYFNQLGNIYLEENNIVRAVESARKGLEMATEEGLKEQIRDASYLLFQLSQKTGEYKKAVEYQTQYYAYRDSIQNLETTQQLANLRTGYEVGQKQAEVDLLLEQKRGNQIVMLTGGIILLIVLILVIIIYSYSKSKTRLNGQLEVQKASLLAANNTKDKFFSIISHDLRGPVNILSGLVSVTRYYLDDKKTDQLKDMMDKMDNSVDRLVKLLDSLLHWSLQQRGHFPYLPESLSLKDILSEAKDMFIDMAVSKSIQLDIDLNEDFNLFIDKNTGATIFRNLLNNAIKFTPSGGHVKVVVEKNSATKMGIIKVVDNGVGIPKDKLKILFRLNENITTVGTSGEAGLGLGLQLVYEFVQLNKGEIQVDSEVGKGTTFTVRLPLDSE
ncbi:MAG: tetratricopeptide repeat-containing sensor histidine kinase [Cyclobacteriaceae bacterium]